MSAEGPTKPTNWNAIEEIAGADNATVLQMLEGAPTADVTLEDHDFDEIRGLAMQLAAESHEKKSSAELIAMAYKQYVESAGQAGAAAMQSMSDEKLREMVEEKGYEMSEEQLAAFRKSGMSVEDWFKERASLNAAAPFDVAVDQSGNVLSQGASAAEALRRAREGQDPDAWRESLK